LMRDMLAFATTNTKRCISCVQLAGEPTKTKVRSGRCRLWQSQVKRIQCEIKKSAPAQAPVTVTTCKTLLGVSNADELWAALQPRLQDGMCEENYGTWHIDHTTPVAAFDLSLLEHQQRCFHVANLAPMWADENMTKGTAVHQQQNHVKKELKEHQEQQPQSVIQIQ